MRPWNQIAVALCLVLALLSPLGAATLARASNTPSLSAIALRTSDLPAGIRLARQGPYKTYLQGYVSGHRWIFKSSLGPVLQVGNIVVKYDKVTDAAQGAIIEGQRQCGPKESIANYHPISPQVGDFATGCYYANGTYTKNNVIMVLRRFSYVAVVHVTGNQALDYFHLTPLTTGYAATVDRRIEIAVHGPGLVGAPPTKPPKKGTKRFITLLSCGHGKGCLFRAQGRGSAYYHTNWSKMPKSWRFQTSSAFKVSYAFACGRYSAVSDGFEMFQRDDLNQERVLRGIGDARDSGTVQSRLFPARHGALQIHVQNSSCQWYVVAYKYSDPFPQP